MEAAVVDAFLEIDPHDAERRQRAGPIVARIDVVGADLADRVVHGVLLLLFCLVAEGRVRGGCATATACGAIFASERMHLW